MRKYPGSDGNGLTLDEFAEQFAGQGFTYANVMTLPRFVEEPPAAVDLRVELAPGLLCNPIISAAMDTVTEWRMAVQMALNGCLGALHANLPIDEAVRQVRRVKRFQMGFIWDPVCLPAEATLATAKAARKLHGFSTFPVSEGPDGGGKFLGLITRSCVEFEHDQVRPVTELMLPASTMLMASSREVKTIEDAKRIFRANPSVGKLPILNDDGTLHALINRRNIVASERYPWTLTDANRQLRVAAAVSTHGSDDERVVKLLEAGTDVLLIDSSQGATGYALKRIAQIRTLSPETPIIAGNVVTPAQAAPLRAAGAHAIKVGMGSGSICITQEQYGLGRAQGRAVYHNTGCIADGGIRNSGDMFKALALGAQAVMVGGYLAGCDEAPGEIIQDKNGRRWREYRGMGSIAAMNARGALRYGGNEGNSGVRVVAQGVEGKVPIVGSTDDRLAEALEGVRGAMRQLGVGSIAELRREVQEGNIRFEYMPDAALREGGVNVSVDNG